MQQLQLFSSAACGNEHATAFRELRKYITSRCCSVKYSRPKYWTLGLHTHTHGTPWSHQSKAAKYLYFWIVASAGQARSVTCIVVIPNESFTVAQLSWHSNVTTLLVTQQTVSLAQEWQTQDLLFLKAASGSRQLLWPDPHLHKSCTDAPFLVW